MTFDTLILGVARPVRGGADRAHRLEGQGLRLGSANGMMRPREKRLGVVDTAIVDQKRLVAGAARLMASI